MIGAVVILYNPDFERLFKGLQALIPQVHKVILVDNSEIDNSERLKDLNLLCKNVKYIPLLKNTGIAAAQNVGIRILHTLNYKYVLFSDQDSIAPNNMVKKLVYSLDLLQKHIPILAIAPLGIDKDTGRRYVHTEGIHLEDEKDGVKYWEVESVMSSFSLVPLKRFEQVGLFNEDLFIDLVENSWGFKANHNFGLKSILLPDITFDHELGTTVKVLGKSLNISSPIRFYYQVRNVLWESKQPYSYMRWLRRAKKMLLPRTLFLLVFTKKRFSYLKYAVKGLIDGISKYKFNKIPQYKGSIAKGCKTFSDWINWYQAQPINLTPNDFNYKGFEEYDKSLLFFEGKPEFLVQYSKFSKPKLTKFSHDDEKIFINLLGLTDSLPLNSLFFELGYDEKLSPVSISFFPKNGNQVFSDEDELLLGKYFDKINNTKTKN
ncbi:MAG: glycosyltransferase family 2 protein [Ruminococcus sp.]|nr:glycosyltransferase family 2 protein [Ruminococcus sp.]